MKKVLMLALMTITLGFTIPTAEAQVYTPQYRYEERQNRNNETWRQQQEEIRRQDRYNRNRHQQMVVLTEYKYVQDRNRVYRETYRSTYLVTRNWRGQYNERLVQRIRIRRDRMYQYDRYRDRDFRNAGIRFNIYLRF